MNKAIVFFLAIIVCASNAVAGENGTNVVGKDYMTHMMPLPPLPPPKRVPPPKPWVNPQRKAIAEFVNDHRPPRWMPILPYMVVESGRANIGGGKYDTLVLLDISGRGYSNTLLVYHGNNGGEFSQEIDGWKMHNLEHMARDLNGDGVDELIIPTELVAFSWEPTIMTPVWPAVYRLENGKYVEDSRDFTNYYDTEVLPRIDSAISAAQSRRDSDALALGLLGRRKILRVLGRQPAAVLNQAYQWMNSSDPTLMQCAIATFADIGGHEQQVHQLRQALPGAIKHEIEARKGG